MNRFKSIASISFCFLALSLSAKADLVVNGGFETGNLSGWTDGGNSGWNSVCNSCAHTGTFGVTNGAVGSESLLSQTIATVIGETYTFSAWLQNDGAGTIHLYWGGVAVVTDSGTSHSYQQFQAVVTASSTSTVIAIGSRDDPGYVQFDDVSVLGAVPEPSTFGLAALALLVPVVARRRRKVN